MTTIRDGEVRVDASAGATPQRIAVQGGFAEVSESGLTLLAEHAQLLG
jgi:F-type H+-transporting ATPase subunit epsilon